MEIPDSISAMVYNTKHSILWTLAIWLVAFIALIPMMTYDERYSAIAFASCVSIALVGTMPLAKNENNTLHNIFGISGCLFSQLWAALSGDWRDIALWWSLYIIPLIVNKDKWCFFAEIWCIISVIYTLTGGKFCGK